MFIEQTRKFFEQIFVVKFEFNERYVYNNMNFNLLNSLVEKNKMGKARIAEKAKISRTTLDNALNGADIKISTIESLSFVLGVSPSIFFTTDPSRPSVNAGGMSGGIVSVADGGGISAVNSTVNAKGSERADNDGIKVIVPRSITELPDTDVYELVRDGRIGDAERLNSFDRFSRFDMYYCVRDDAMSPLFMRGDILALANIPRGAVFQNGSPMVVDTRPCGFVFRRVYDAGDALGCRVANAESGYADTVIPKSQVIRLYRVVGLLRIGN